MSCAVYISSCREAAENGVVIGALVNAGIVLPANVSAPNGLTLADVDHAAIESCSVFIMLVDNNYFNCPKCELEVLRAIERRSRKNNLFPKIVTVRIEVTAQIPNIGGILHKISDKVLYDGHSLSVPAPAIIASLSNALLAVARNTLGGLNNAIKIALPLLTNPEVLRLLYSIGLSQYTQRFKAFGVTGVELNLWHGIPVMEKRDNEILHNFILHHKYTGGIPAIYFQPDNVWEVDVKIFFGFFGPFRPTYYVISLYNTKTNKTISVRKRFSQIVEWSNKLLVRLPQLKGSNYFANAPHRRYTQEERLKPGLVHYLSFYSHEHRNNVVHNTAKEVTKEVQETIFARSFRERRRHFLQEFISDVASALADPQLVGYVFDQLREGSKCWNLSGAFYLSTNNAYTHYIPLSSLCHF